MLYLASPYSHKDSAVVNERFLKAEAAVHYLLSNEIWVYGPIVHCHEIARKYSLPKDFAYWQNYNKHVIERSDKFVVLTIDGWKESVGIAGEYAHAYEHNLEIGLMNPDTFEILWVPDDIIEPTIECLFEV